MAGMKVQVVEVDKDGNIDMVHLKALVSPTGGSSPGQAVVSGATCPNPLRGKYSQRITLLYWRLPIEALRLR